VPYYESHPIEAFKSSLNDNTLIRSSKGCHTYRYLPEINKSLTKEDGFLVEYFNVTEDGNDFISSKVLTGSKFWIFEGFAKDIVGGDEKPDILVKFSCTYTPNITGEHDFEIFAIGKSKLLIDETEIIDNWTNTSPGDAFFAHGTTSKRGNKVLKKNKSYKIEIQYKFEGNFPAIYIGCQPPDKIDLMDEALNIAKDVEQVVLMVGTNSDWETEGNDRIDFNLPGKQNELIEKVLEINPNTIVVLNTGSPINMPWINKAKAVIQSWYAGQEYGNALVDILTGAINPSGKLPTTFPISLSDTPAFESYPGKNLQMDYDEKLLVGYKWYDKNLIKPLYPFGHGLSYTEFEYSELNIKKDINNNFISSYMVKNIGDTSGSEISQCYVQPNESANDEPIKTLQGFDKTFLNPGESKKIEIILSKRNFSSWDLSKNEWGVAHKEYDILIGSSSRDIRLVERIKF
jgi:beta-glucosidase